MKIPSPQTVLPQVPEVPQAPLPQTENGNTVSTAKKEDETLESLLGRQTDPTNLEDQKEQRVHFEKTVQEESLLHEKLVGPFDKDPEELKSGSFSTSSHNYEASGIDARQSVGMQSSRPVLVVFGAELFSPQRKTCFGILLLVIAAIGLMVAMIRPPSIPRLVNTSQPGSNNPCENESVFRTTIYTEINGTILCVEPTVSPAPTMSSVPSNFPTNSNNPTRAPVTPSLYDILYSKVQKFIVDSQVSNVASLPTECNHPLCTGNYYQDTLTLQQRTVNYLLTQDQVFFKWVNNNEIYQHTERVLERYILTLMAFSLRSNGWKSKQNWPIENGFGASEEVCNWSGITCGVRPAYINMKDFVDHTFLSKTEIGGREVETVPMVTMIILRNNTLIGELPQEVFKLRHLKELKLHYNQITGSIPNSIGLLSNLEKLWLHGTLNMSGTLPTEMKDLSRLSSLFLGFNKLHGTIPKEIGRLTDLQYFSLVSNDFSGPIPDEITKLTKLKYLFLDMNRFNETIPELGQLTALEDLRLENNALSGSLPYSMGQLKKLQIFYAYNNNLNGGLGNNIVVGWDSLGTYFSTRFYALTLSCK